MKATDTHELFIFSLPNDLNAEAMREIILD
jgi:hypothetical protein